MIERRVVMGGDTLESVVVLEAHVQVDQICGVFFFHFSIYVSLKENPKKDKVRCDASANRSNVSQTEH